MRSHAAHTIWRGRLLALCGASSRARQGIDRPAPRFLTARFAHAVRHRPQLQQRTLHRGPRSAATEPDRAPGEISSSTMDRRMTAAAVVERLAAEAPDPAD